MAHGRQRQLSKARIGVLGASGYTGAELVRLLLRHPAAEIALLTADRRAGQEMRQVFPQFSPFELPKLRRARRHRLGGRQARSGVLRAAARHHPEGDRRICRSAPKTQGGRSLGRLPARRPGRLCALVRPRAPCAASCSREAVYGLAEVYRDEIKRARLVANPGCYTTCAQLALIPLLRERAIDPGRDRDRRQVRHDRRGQGGEGGDAVLRGVGRLPRLWRRPSPPHGRARPGVLARPPAARSRSASRRTSCR